jgi:hypothetical protein
MGIVIFTVGFFIFSTYIFFYVFNRRVEEKIERIKNDDNIDYDGHGNWGRFPPETDSQS